jgi:predicted DsbA family dithiol-disulfide isomerase
MTDHVRSFFGSRGLDYNPHPEVVPNSLRALRLTELGRDLGRHPAVHDRLMDAYWSEGRDIGQVEVLRSLAAEVDLPAEAVDDVLTGELYRDRVESSTREAVAIGANAVPAFLLDRRLLVLGAQPEELFEQAFSQLAGGA